MNFSKVIKGSIVPTLIVGAFNFVGMNSAEAANLTGPGTINFGGTVNIKQTVVSDNGTPANLVDDISKTSFDFLPNMVSPGTGGVTIPFLGGTDGFSGFNGTNPATLFTNNKSVIKDTVVDGSLPPNYLAAALPAFLELKDETGVGTGTFFNLERVDLPTYVSTGSGRSALTTATLNVYGTWYDTLTDTSYTGEGQFTAQFVGFASETAVLTALRTPAGFTTSFSASIDAEEIEIPEPSTLLGLGVVGLLSLAGTRKQTIK